MSKEDFFEKLDTLLKIRPLTPEAVGHVISPKATKREEESNEFFAMYVAKGGEEDGVKKVELRVPLQSKEGRDGLLILELGPKLNIDLEDVMARYGRNPRFSPADPRAPDSVPSYYSYTVEGAELSFGVRSDQSPKLLSVIIDRSSPRR
ncbi:MAG TPA: hypothetical protein VNI02_15165 [Blastocatellia bacterium]|jgi:hypothetical protein|nr:hypothetical protein [Blastocatellia bacterium]